MVKFICNGCGKEEEGHYDGRIWHKPGHWFSRNVDGGKSEVHACSRGCIELIDRKEGKSVPVLPI